jgi:hypothetical protein
MSDRTWTLIGASYAVFALVTFMAAVEKSPAICADQPQDVASIPEVPAVYNSGLFDAEGVSRNEYWITIWTTRNCGACEKQKALVPAFEAAGYNIVIRKSPGGRWIKSFPALVITKGKPGGDILHTFYGVHTVERIDEILEIGETPEEDVEDPDYDIFSPKACEQEFRYRVVAYVYDNEEVREQFKELGKLRDSGLFSVKVYVVFAKEGKIRVSLTDADNDRLLGLWLKPVTAHVILMTIQGRT